MLKSISWLTILGIALAFGYFVISRSIAMIIFLNDLGFFDGFGSAALEIAIVVSLILSSRYLWKRSQIN